jgi:hypothetical protein
MLRERVALQREREREGERERERERDITERETGIERERGRERERERGTTGCESLRAAHTLVAGEGGRAVCPPPRPDRRRV